MRRIFNPVLSPSLAGAARTAAIPMTPKAIDAQIKIRVAIFCMLSVYQTSLIILWLATSIFFNIFDIYIKV